MAEYEKDVLDVTVDRGATEHELHALRDVFRGVGVDASVRDDYVRLSGQILPYVVMFVAPVTWVGAKFAGGAAEKAGADAWDAFRDGGWAGLRRFLHEVAATRTTEGSVTIRNPTGPDVQLYEKIPDEALQELAELDWERMGPGRLGWSAGGWHYLALGADRAVDAPRRNDL